MEQEAGRLIQWNRAAIAITAATYELNSSGHGWVSFIAASALTRLAIEKMMPKGHNLMKWSLAIVATAVGTLAYGVIAGMLNPDLQAPDRHHDLP